MLNAIKYFSNTPFLIINPDTIWNSLYLKELKLMERIFFEDKKKECLLLLVDKRKSFDKSFRGDFNLENYQVNRKNDNNLNYIYTGLQIVKPAVFSNINMKIFSINKIWDNLIECNQLNGIESNINFLHVSTLNIYQSILKKKLNFK